MATATKELKQRLAQESEIQITVTGRKTGHPITNIVWFVLEGDKLSLLPVRGSDSQWFKNVLANPRIKISVGDVEGEFKATPTTDPHIVSSVVGKFRKKYGSEDVKKYYSKFDAAVVVEVGKEEPGVTTQFAAYFYKLSLHLAKVVEPLPTLGFAHL